MTQPRPIRLTAALTREDEWYLARCLEVEVTSQGETFEEALANLREALELYFEDQPVPTSAEPIVAHWRCGSRLEPGIASRLRAGGRQGSGAGGVRASQHPWQPLQAAIPQRARTAIVPLHRELASGTLASILRQAGLSTEEFKSV